jgi:hypothetical protein
LRVAAGQVFTPHGETFLGFDERDLVLHAQTIECSGGKGK